VAVIEADCRFLLSGLKDHRHGLHDVHKPKHITIVSRESEDSIAAGKNLQPLAGHLSLPGDYTF
jgi:hypothetical protein